MSDAAKVSIELKRMDSNPDLDSTRSTSIVAAPLCEIYSERMLWATLIPTFRWKRWRRWIFPVLTNLVQGTASFCLLYYPSYYPNQGIVWTIDIVIGWIVYAYLLYLQTRWEKAACLEPVNVSKLVNRVTLAFYWLYMIYWFYFLVIQFSIHNEPSVLIQLGNTLMSTAWYLFFSTIAYLYYIIIIKLSQRSRSIEDWLKDMKVRRPSLDDFYNEYNEQHRKSLYFSRYWNFMIFIGFLLLTFHVPLDLVSVIYQRVWVDLPGFIIKIFSLAWYIYHICSLNDTESFLISYFYKHRLYSIQEMEGIERYMGYRPLGLDFYGIKINKSFVMKIALVVFNLIIPTLYALFSNIMKSV
jgi:hypothetical protein